MDIWMEKMHELTTQKMVHRDVVTTADKFKAISLVEIQELPNRKKHGLTSVQ